MYVCMYQTNHGKSAICIQNRSISSTAAQITIQCRLYFILRWQWIVPQQRIHGHNKSGRAKAALRAMKFRDTFLRNIGGVLIVGGSLIQLHHYLGSIFGILVKC